MTHAGSGNRGPARVAVLGGGFGGLETAFGLRMLAGDRAHITLVSDVDHFYFKPNSIYVPFGLDPQRLRVPLARPAARKDIQLVAGSAESIDADSRRIHLANGGAVDYDFCVVATGSGMRAEEVPGLAEHAISTWTADDMVRLRTAFEKLAAGAQERGAAPSAVLRSAQQQVRRTAVRDRPDARDVAAPPRRPWRCGDRLVYVRERIHPGLRPSPR
jgi:NADH dehydrogenase FAD-containing subunit